ncbi:MAG: polymer-forming cytoskeletal protein [Ruminiclostridium sp.]|nr:polymer-forming cytoskeletal protein [Ruminiclostridium sp.]
MTITTAITGGNRDNRDNRSYNGNNGSYSGNNGNYNQPRSDRQGSYSGPQQGRDYGRNQGYNGGNTYPLGSRPEAQRRNYSDSADTEITIISRNTMIDGNVRSLADMSIDGNVRGDVETTKDVELNGRIIGNMTCNNANMFASQVQGNIVLKGSVDIGRDTLLIGDLNSGYACINGKVKGNVDISGKAEFRADAVIFGDISASTITVDDGAIIQGYVSTTFLNKLALRHI